MLVAVGHGGCWLVVVVVGVTPRVLRVDILAKVLSSQETIEYQANTKCGAIQDVCLLRIPMRVLLA